MYIYIIKQFVKDNLINEKHFFTFSSAKREFLTMSQITSIVASSNLNCEVTDLVTEDFQLEKDDRTVIFKTKDNKEVAKVMMYPSRLIF